MSFRVDGPVGGLVTAPWHSLEERSYADAFALLDDPTFGHQAFERLAATLLELFSGTVVSLWLVDHEIDTSYPMATMRAAGTEMNVQRQVHEACQRALAGPRALEDTDFSNVHDVHGCLLRGPRTIVGALGIVAPSPPSPEDLTRAAQLSARLCIALSRGRESGELARQRAELLTVNRRLEAVLREGEQREQRLERTLNDLKNARSSLEERTVELASIGQLASGVAHEINNPATYVTANLERLEQLMGPLDALPPDVHHELLGLVSEAREGIERIAGICRELLPLSRTGPSLREAVDLRSVARAACRMVANKIRHRAQLVLEFTDVGLIAGDANRLIQVVTNLITNACDAIPSGAPDRHSITVRTHMIDGRSTLTVRDTGVGIPAHVRPSVFRPFFTTKPREQGTGLGLYVSRKIVEEHRGTIDVDSEVGIGSTFRISFAPTNTAPKAQRETGETAPTARAKVLLVDDESAIVRVLGRVIRRHHDVREFFDGADALKCLLHEDFDIVVSDLMMPGLSGQELFRQATRARPELAQRFVFCSGGAFTEDARQFAEANAALVLHKPITGRALLAVINERLAEVGPLPRNE